MQCYCISHRTYNVLVDRKGGVLQTERRIEAFNHEVVIVVQSITAVLIK